MSHKTLLLLTCFALLAACASPAGKARSVLDAFAASQDVTAQCEDIVPDLEKAMADIVDKRSSATEQETQDIKSALAVCKARTRGQRVPVDEIPAPAPEPEKSAPELAPVPLPAAPAPAKKDGGH